MDSCLKTKERRIRRLARRHGYALRKSRARKYLHSNNRGRYMLLDPWHNRIALGERFELSLDGVEVFLK